MFLMFVKYTQVENHTIINFLSLIFTLQDSFSSNDDLI